MERSYVSELKNGKEVLLKGWVHEIRELSKMKFLLLRDSSGIVQCLVKDENLLKNLPELTLESVVEIIGNVKKANIKAEFARKDIEIEISNIKILNKAEELPIQVNEKTITTELSKRLDYRSLDVRKPKIAAIFRIQSTIINGFREFFYKNKFMEIQPPGIIATSTEGGTDLFEVQYFEKKAYLAQSPQLYKQLMAISLERVFSTNTIWRAEKHDTTKHINEIRQMDIECAFYNDLEIMKWLEKVVQYIVKKVISDCSEELKLLELKLEIPKAKYLTYKEAIDLLSKKGIKIKYGDDFEPEAERKLCSLFPNTVIFTYEWPIELKPFYIWPKNKEKGISGGFDALFGGLEISSGGQRVHIPEILIEQLKSKKLNPENFKWYVDAFRFGAPMHAGWSVGLERLTHAICKLDNIREGTLFPRDRRRLTP
ncbi:aspartate--tRNA(Asn) ligase [Candidatus Pacearchaeota archaeon]|nr:aspartate--tRNA(Asn) ligase [Candidatus Pacearchaeota archaeon]